jgi:hypothetical protein
MEISVAQHLATLNASLFIIDCDWNMDGPTIAGKKTAFLRSFMLKMIILPRQARGRHRENSTTTLDGPMIAARAVPLAQYLRSNGHASTPIVFAEGSDWPAHWISNAR